MSTSSSQRRVSLRYDVGTVSDAWVLDEEPVPESRSRDLTVELIRSLLAAWAARTGRSLQVGRNLAVRWEAERCAKEDALRRIADLEARLARETK